MFGHILFSFTRGVTEHYNPQEPEHTTESFGFSPLESTGQEWYRHEDPNEECIYQEYSDREATALDFIRFSRINASLIDASLPEENEETEEDQQNEDRAMSWKRLRPSALRTVYKSMYIGALISLLTATIIGSVYMSISYLYFKTASNCEFHPKRSIPIHVQWTRTLSAAIACVFLYTLFFVVILFLFRPHQLMGVKGKLILVICLAYFLDTTYRLILQALGISHSKLSTSQKSPLYVMFFMGVCWQAYILTNYFLHQGRKRRKQMALFLQITVPSASIMTLAIAVKCIIYPFYKKQRVNRK